MSELSKSKEKKSSLKTKLNSFFSKIINTTELAVGAASLSEFVEESIPAIESDFDVTLFVKKGVISKYLDQSAPSAQGLTDSIYLWSTLDISAPRLGYSFINMQSGYGFLESVLQSGDPITIVYYDLNFLPLTQVLNTVYESQITQYGTLALGATNLQLSVNNSTMTLTFSEGRITRPIPTSVNAESNNLLKFTFQFTYQDYDIKVPGIARLKEGQYVQDDAEEQESQISNIDAGGVVDLVKSYSNLA